MMKSMMTLLMAAMAAIALAQSTAKSSNIQTKDTSYELFATPNFPLVGAGTYPMKYDNSTPYTIIPDNVARSYYQAYPPYSFNHTNHGNIVIYQFNCDEDTDPNHPPVSPINGREVAKVMFNVAEADGSHAFLTTISGIEKFGHGKCQGYVRGAIHGNEVIFGTHRKDTSYPSDQ